MSRPLRFGLSALLFSVNGSGPDSLSIHLARERHQRADLVALLLDVLLDGQLPAHRLQRLPTTTIALAGRPAAAPRGRKCSTTTCTFWAML
jgi:hypothetical protein